MSSLKEKNFICPFSCRWSVNCSSFMRIRVHAYSLLLSIVTRFPGSKTKSSIERFTSNLKKKWATFNKNCSSTRTEKKHCSRLIFAYLKYTLFLADWFPFHGAFKVKAIGSPSININSKHQTTLLKLTRFYLDYQSKWRYHN